MSSAHKSCVLLCQPSEAEARRKTKLCNVDNNMKLMAAAALAPPGRGDTPEPQSPLEGRLRLLSIVHSGTSVVISDAGFSHTGAGCGHIGVIIFSMCNFYWGITEWRNVTRGWIIFMNHWRILVHVHCQRTETFFAKCIVLAKMCHESGQNECNDINYLCLLHQ